MSFRRDRDDLPISVIPFTEYLVNRAHNDNYIIEDPRMTARFTPLIIVLVVWTLPAWADLYAFTDENGVLNITNVPSYDTRYKLIHKEPKSAPRQSYSSGSLRSMRTAKKPLGLDGMVSQAAQTYQVDPALVHAVIHAESGFNPQAISPKGASGLMQLMPDTARRYGVRDIFDPAENINGGVRYLRDLLQMFGQNKRLAVAAYNAGENAVLRFGGIPPYPETTHYVSRVLSLHSRYRRSG